jgi:hypothetical protein
MVGPPKWSKEEFEILLQNHRLMDEELTKLLPRRRVGAIRVVRSFIHSFHRGGNVSGLSKMMIHRLEQGSWACPRSDCKRD